MVRGIRILEMAAAAILLSTAASRSGSADRPNNPWRQRRNSSTRTHAPSRIRQPQWARAPKCDATAGNLSDKLARSGGVICPPKMSIRRSRSRPHQAAQCQ